MKFSVFASITLLFSLYTSLPFAANGNKLHKNNCTSCHISMHGGDGSAMYTRKDHKVTSHAGLQKQVRLCKNNLGLQWFDKDVADVITYLNDDYYKFSTDTVNTSK